MASDERSRIVRILWIENDQEFTGLMTRLLPRRLRPLRVEIVVARHMEEGAELLKGGAGAFAVLIVDIMLPRNKEAADKAETLERQRREVLHKIDEVRESGRPEADSEVRSQRDEIDELDRAIESWTDLEGGVHLLEACAPAFRQVPTLFLTARSAPGLKERAHKLVADDCFHWLQKPAKVGKIVEVLGGWLGGR